ncbi:hypothetical protein ThidrDRAFT_3733 [Thiorhodococcus drewsii AZ1]|uniref:Uncharacterized protein n=1 Tax=Thiorhodococcus drewsii AZ1 TaxID=765913 RepID=G2E620_9GAMM|nr:hypothetical protein [Thiorhodococcus drewsii]EGV28505.1 hypothetical protein ThidrDRAFT_3733 [Thiorhodococcus drewsii AZ1]
MENQETAQMQDLSAEERMRHYQKALETCRAPACFREEVLQNVYRSLIDEYRAQAQRSD